MSTSAKFAASRAYWHVLQRSVQPPYATHIGSTERSQHGEPLFGPSVQEQLVPEHSSAVEQFCCDWAPPSLFEGGGGAGSVSLEPHPTAAAAITAATATRDARITRTTFLSRTRVTRLTLRAEATAPAPT